MKESISHFNKTLGNLTGKRHFCWLYVLYCWWACTHHLSGLLCFILSLWTQNILHFSVLFTWFHRNMLLVVPALSPSSFRKYVCMAVLSRLLVLVLSLQILDPCLAPPWYLCLSDGHIRLNSATVCLNLILSPLKKLTANRTTARILAFPVIFQFVHTRCSCLCPFTFAILFYFWTQ